MIRCIHCAHDSYVPDCDCCEDLEHCVNCKQPIDPEDGCGWCCPCHGEYPCPGGLETDHYHPASGQTPWEKRGVVLPKNTKYPNWQVAWPILAQGHQTTDVCQAASDFYILDALRHAVINRDHECDARPCRHFELWQTDLRDERIEAETRFAGLTIHLDLIFCDYVEMACGGELRHHSACGGKSLSGHRRTAWADWRWIHEQLGHQALLDGAELFDEFPGGAFGGARWAHALRLLHKRVTGQISPITWVDQVFTLVHNGGVFLNKLDWAVKNRRQWGLHYLQERVLPAQQADAWPVLLRLCTDETRHLWDRYWRASNKARVSMAVPPTVNHRSHPRRRIVCSSCGSNPRNGHMMSCRHFLDGHLQQGIDLVSHIDEEEWAQYHWHIWNQSTMPVLPNGKVRMLPDLAYAVQVEVHSTNLVRLRQFKVSGRALVDLTMRFNRAMPTVPGWDEGDDTEFWFVIELMDERERVRLGSFESRRTTNRDAFKKKYITFGHILPLVMPDIDWSYLVKEHV